ncbi:MAG: amidohydrolase family protein [Polyangia bacterium]
MRTPKTRLSCLLAGLFVWMGCSGDGLLAGGGIDDMMPSDPIPSVVPPPVITNGASDKFLLVGTLLKKDGAERGELLVESNLITCVGTGCSATSAAQTATKIETGGIIMPGMLDGHNHGLFNIFDEEDWNPGKFYGSHNDWTSDVRYQQVLDAKQYLNRDVTSPVDLRCEIDKYAEIKALISGTTSFTLAPGAADLACYSSLARTIDTSRNGLGVDKLRTSISVPSAATAQTVCTSFANGSCNAYAVHVAEGINATAKNEFATLESRAGGCLLAPQTAIVHGTALGNAEFTKMAATGMKLIWSPKSNLFLYNDTTRIDQALLAGVSTIALAPDWSLGGSVNLLDELKVAQSVSQNKFSGMLTPKQLFLMVTLDAARALGVDLMLGSLEVGKRADLVLVRKQADDPYAALLAASGRDVDLVMVDGKPLYGTLELKTAASSSPVCDELSLCGQTKFLCVAESSTLNKLNQTYQEIVDTLTSNLSAYDSTVGMGAPLTPLAPLLRCP